ncbi:MAG TPA: MraY family glycosyltransferase [Thermoanaerobaculia bacterium]
MPEFALPLVLLFLCSALTSYFSTGVVKHAAERIGLVDTPGERKLHRHATPRLGGIAIIFGFGFPLLLMAGNTHAASLVSKNLTYLFAVLSSGSLIVGLGVYDDLLGTNAPKKFAVQTAAALILVLFGFQFNSISIAGQNFDLGVFGIIASTIWIVGVINAMNLIDGMDSLATVIAATIAIAFAIIALLRYDVFSLVIMTALAGSLLGFYPWNRPPAKIFMGDTGSLFIGLLLAAISIARPSKSPTALIIGGPILALALPVLDTLIVMRTRFKGAKVPLTERLTRVFTADRNHIHHVLVAKYGSDAKAIFGIWLVTVLFAAAAVMTVHDTTKMIGYTSGIVAFVAMLLLRRKRREVLENEEESDERRTQKAE